MSYNTNSSKSDYSFIENKKFNKNIDNISDKKIINNNLYKDFCFWINHHSNLSNCITKIHNFSVKYIYVFLFIILFYFFNYYQ
jgi:hypothetical protein